MDTDDLTMIADGLERILIDAPLEMIDQTAGVGQAAEALWTTLEESGFLSLCVTEDHGGIGAGLEASAMLARLGASRALTLPLVDTALARGLLSTAGIAPPAHRIALRDPIDPAMPIAHAAQCDAVLTIDEGHLQLLAIEPSTLRPAHGAEDGASHIAREPTRQIVAIAAPDWLTADSFRALAAYVRSASMSGAMQAVLDLTLAYTGEREQFGRPLAKFQAIQHHLSEIACETAAASAAIEMAGDALLADPFCGSATIDEIAIAKIRCCEAASRIAGAAHQAHGAMGFTREYALGRFTRRLWQWQDEFGTAQDWAQRLGHAVLTGDSPSLWPAITRAS